MHSFCGVRNPGELSWVFWLRMSAEAAVLSRGSAGDRPVSKPRLLVLGRIQFLVRLWAELLMSCCGGATFRFSPHAPLHPGSSQHGSQLHQS